MSVAARVLQVCLIALAFLPTVTNADEADAVAESKRWRHLFREEQFNRLLLELAERNRPTPLVIRDATLLTMSDEEAPTGHSVVIRDGIISDIASAQTVSARGEVKEIDGTGKFLLPGLTDSHTHTLVSNGDYLLDLVNGVTTVREMDGFGWLLSLRASVRDNKLLAPNIHLTGTILNGFEMEWYATVVRDPEKARALVREHHAAGYDFIKVHNVLKPAVYDAILEEAQKLKIDVVGHIPHDIALSKAIACGQRTFEHLKGYYSDRSLEITKEDYVGLTKGAEVWNCPTLYTHRIGLRGDDVRTLLDREEAKFLSSDLRDEWRLEAAGASGENHRKIHEQSRAILKNLLPIEPQLIAGTDSGGGYPMMVRGFALHEELRLLHEAGVSNGDCLRAATVNAAQAMRKVKEFGRVERGLRADLLLVNGDPRVDLSALSRIEGVCVRGIWLDRAALDRIRSRLLELFAGDQGLAAGQLPPPERMDALASAMVELEGRGAIQMDHNLREMLQLLKKHKRPTGAVEKILASRAKN